MPSTSFQSTVSVTHITTAAAILSIDDVNFLLDPNFDKKAGFILTKTDDPAIGLEDLPVIHAVLLSHEDHMDNLDASGRTMLNGRHVLTTLDGAKNLAPRPGVRGLAPWESVTLKLNGKEFKITGTPTQHLPDGECTGFVLESSSFGVNEADGLPNVVYVSGDTVHIPELATELPKRYHIVLALLNLGKATVSLPTGPLHVTMDGVEGAQLTRDIRAEKMVTFRVVEALRGTRRRCTCRIGCGSRGEGKVMWLVPRVKTTIV
ncbi:hypothetical protein P3T76_003455 [Phytophthora citrophthora]|uniref:Metallo-beta-lactamase domain-containing protein n=1 Tax=Phytophthora citrophthora TaxID=4793 RepID=A0AAD9GUK8_9STRA|nr:hypothetical protein P3T76_003455 [Phytophthora citrophthora]